MLALSAAAAGAGPSGGATEDPVEAPPPSGSPFERQGMWIWYVSRSEGGSLGRIVARARRHGVGTVYVKAGDATDGWGQFSRHLVRRLHQGGLDVCAWTFVYGRYPAAEARVAAAAIEKGADCFVIDAEGHYEGRYASADRYMQVLRKRVGAAYPLALSSFPYVDYHPAFPYSVFLGPGGAQFNLPQMYWKAIGTTVRGVYDHTILFNRICGQADPPDRADLRRPRAPADQALSPVRDQPRRPGAELVVVAGDELGRVGRAGVGRRRRGGRLPAGQRPPDPAPRVARRPRRLGPAAPGRRPDTIFR